MANFNFLQMTTAIQVAARFVNIDLKSPAGSESSSVFVMKCAMFLAFVNGIACCADEKVPVIPCQPSLGNKGASCFPEDWIERSESTNSLSHPFLM